MPRRTFTQAVLVEVALALAAVGLAAGGAWMIALPVVGAVLVLVALVPRRRRWLYQLLGSWLGFRGRRRGARRGGGRSALGDLEIVSMPLPNSDDVMGVVQSGSTWTLPLEATLDGVLNDDAPVPIEQLRSLLKVEDVRLASVRLMTVVAAAHRAAAAPQGPSAPANQIAARYCLLTLDTNSASDAIANRGGSHAAVEQILRRCALRAEQLLESAGVTLRRLDPRAVRALIGSTLAPEVLGEGAVAAERWDEMLVSGTWSVSFAIGGSGPDVVDKALAVASNVGAPIAVTTVLIRPLPRGGSETVLLMRLSGPQASPDRTAVRRAADLARATGLDLQPLGGEQGALLRVTTPAGVV